MRRRIAPQKHFVRNGITVSRKLSECIRVFASLFIVVLAMQWFPRLIILMPFSAELGRD